MRARDALSCSMTAEDRYKRYLMCLFEECVEAYSRVPSLVDVACLSFNRPLNYFYATGETGGIHRQELPETDGSFNQVSLDLAKGWPRTSTFISIQSYQGRCVLLRAGLEVEQYCFRHCCHRELTFLRISPRGWLHRRRSMCNIRRLCDDNQHFTNYRPFGRNLAEKKLSLVLPLDAVTPYLHPPPKIVY